MRCAGCGRSSENGIPTHYIGCERPQSAAVRERTHESDCLKDGCTNPRAVSKGPRPTKYCDDHKTGSKK